MSAPLVFVDIESDGLRPDCRVWEVAMIRREPDGTEHELQLFIDIKVDQAEPRALEIGGYYDRHPSGRRQSDGRAWMDKPPVTPDATAVLNPPAFPSPVTCPARVYGEGHAARVVARWTHGAHLVAANPAFDADRLGRMLRRHGHAPGWHYHLVDVVAMAGAALRQPPPWKSDDLAAALGVEPAGDDRHTAMGDARWAARIYDTVMAAGVRPHTSGASA